MATRRPASRHVWTGNCPMPEYPEARDPCCPACRELDEPRPIRPLRRQPIEGPYAFGVYEDEAR